MIVHHVHHRFNQHTLASQWMETLHVQQQMPIADPQRRSLFRLLLFIVPGEFLGDGWVNDLGVAAAQAKFERSAHRPLTVERRERRFLGGGSKEIRPAALARVVPDFWGRGLPPDARSPAPRWN